jgi:hypothetical protein
MEGYLKDNRIIEGTTPEIEAFQKEFEDNYDNAEYLDSLFHRVEEYAEGTEEPVREAYILMDEIDERILELKYGS